MPSSNYNKLVAQQQPKRQDSSMQSQVLVNGKPVAVQVKTSIEKTFEKPKVVVHAGCVLDASTSMTWAADPKTDHSKTKMAVVLDSLHDMYKKVLENDDRCTVSFFNDRYKQVFFNTKVAILKTQRARLNEEAGKMGGGTAFYDSTMKALASMQATKQIEDNHGNKVLNNLIVFTDGEDNSSKDYDLSRMIAALMKPGLSNFHATIIAVGGADAMRAADSMRTEIAKYKQNHVYVITTHSIQTAFDASIKRLREKKEQLKEKIQIEFIQKGKKSAPVMPHVMGSLLGAAAGGSILDGGSRRMLPLGQGIKRQERGRSASPARRNRSSSRTGAAREGLSY